MSLTKIGLTVPLSIVKQRLGKKKRFYISHYQPSDATLITRVRVCPIKEDTPVRRQLKTYYLQNSNRNNMDIKLFPIPSFLAQDWKIKPSVE